MKLYVDVDETLVFWDNPLYPFYGKYIINTDLVNILKDGINTNKYDITIWSAGGTRWAEKINQTLFSEYNLPSSGKHELYHDVSNSAYAIDDRLKEDRFYLYRFKKVFLPEEFIEYVKNNKTNSSEV